MSLFSAAKRVVDTQRDFRKYTRLDQIEALRELAEEVTKLQSRPPSPSPAPTTDSSR
jgi:hypothetical protein